MIQQDSLFNELAIRDASPFTPKDTKGDGVESNEKKEINKKDKKKSEEGVPFLINSIAPPTSDYILYIYIYIIYGYTVVVRPEVSHILLLHD